MFEEELAACDSAIQQGRRAAVSCVCEGFPARQAKAAIQALADRNPHAAVRTKVSNEQKVPFAKPWDLVA